MGAEELLEAVFVAILVLEEVSIYQPVAKSR